MTRIVQPTDPEPRPAPVREWALILQTREEADAWLARVYAELTTAGHTAAAAEVKLYITDGGDPIPTARAVRGVLGEMGLESVVEDADTGRARS